MSGTWIKDPDAVLDYTVDWSAWLESGDTIDSSDVEVAPDGVTVDAVIDTGTAVTAWISGGDAGVDYTVRFRVTTVGIRTDDRTITLLVRQR
jgi:hypothetical protein